MAAPRQPGTYAVQSPAVHMPLPMTPQSAALGPAVQATVPSTPQSATFNGMFSGNVFERADAFLTDEWLLGRLLTSWHDDLNVYERWHSDSCFNPKPYELYELSEI